MNKRHLALIASVGLVMFSCKKETVNNSGSAKINFVFKFDSTQARLDNIGNPSTIPAGRSAQSPLFNSMSAHYVELAPDQFTALGSGAVLYRAPETTAGGANAIDFEQSVTTGNGQTFLSVPVSSLAAGSYRWLRVSLAYQNYDINYRYNGANLTGTIASFIGFNTFLRDFKIKDSSMVLNGNRLQGYWAFETNYMGFGAVSSGQAPAGATTVVNPLQATSPIPSGSCVVTGAFSSPLVITGNESSDITVIVSLSTNKSFEWIDLNADGYFDPLNGESVVDMGIRGLIPSVQ